MSGKMLCTLQLSRLFDGKNLYQFIIFIEAVSFCVPPQCTTHTHTTYNASSILQTSLKLLYGFDETYTCGSGSGTAESSWLLVT
jgi:hypothetical protein